MPPVPPANRSPKGPGDKSEVPKDAATSHAEINTAEQGDTVNIRACLQLRMIIAEAS
jgi:hypothetical protein